MPSPSDTSSGNSTAEALSQKLQDLRLLLSELIASVDEAAPGSQEPNGSLPEEGDEAGQASPQSSESKEDVDPYEVYSREIKELMSLLTERIVTAVNNATRWGDPGLVEYQLSESTATTRHGRDSPPNHPEENSREEALIISAIAGPDATPADKKQVTDGAAEVHHKLAVRDTGGVAGGAARSARPARLMRPQGPVKEERREDPDLGYERELEAMRRLVGMALGKGPGGEGLDSLTAIERRSLAPLREVLGGASFRALMADAGSFDGAIDRLFGMMWRETKMREEMWKAEEKKKKKGKDTSTRPDRE